MYSKTGTVVHDNNVMECNTEVRGDSGVHSKEIQRYNRMGTKWEGAARTA